ncbi:hypothetical protein [Roseateles sp.]|uniref:hypothetical protein n=1 Tax=Roseateles sp. TaxID=1971397 RepID=UPI003BA8586B
MLDRVEATVPALQAAGDAAQAASERMREQADGAEQRILALSEAAKGHAVKHISGYAAQAMRHARDAEVVRMSAAARAVFRQELAATLRQQTRDRSGGLALTWKALLGSHLAACAAASIATWASMTF